MIPSRCCIQYASKSGRPSSGHRTGRGQSSSQFTRRDVNKECANHQTIAFISHASKVMLKFLHTRPRHYANQELADDQAGFRKGRGTEIKWPTFDGSERKLGNSKKKKKKPTKNYLCFISYTKAFDCVDHNKP